MSPRYPLPCWVWHRGTVYVSQDPDDLLYYVWIDDGAEADWTYAYGSKRKAITQARATYKAIANATLP